MFSFRKTVPSQCPYMHFLFPSRSEQCSFNTLNKVTLCFFFLLQSCLIAFHLNKYNSGRCYKTETLQCSRFLFMNIRVAVRTGVSEYLIIKTWNKIKDGQEQGCRSLILWKPQERAISALTQSCGQQNGKNEAPSSAILSWGIIGNIC